MGPVAVRGIVSRPLKWADAETTAAGKSRARVEPGTLETLWFNTGTLCNIECAHCYVESSPRNDSLSFLSAAEVACYLDELGTLVPGEKEIGFTGGEPFLNAGLPAMAEDALSRGHGVLILTNGMKPMRNHSARLIELKERHGRRLRLRVSLDHHSEAVHGSERGPGSWRQALDGLRWLVENGFEASVAGRSLVEEEEEAAREGYRRLFAGLGLALDAADRERLVLFPEMDEGDPPEITTECWGILGLSPGSIMCATSRMVVKRKGARSPEVVSCTLLPHDGRFSMGGTLADSWRPVSLLHRRCASFCVLGGSACS